MRLVRRAAEHPVSVLMVYIAVLVFGLISFRQLDRELLPRISLPEAQVLTEYEGLPAAEVEALITVPVENALASVNAVRSIQSLSVDERSSVCVRFDWGVDQELAAVQIREKIDALYPFLPNGATKPRVATTDAGTDQPLLTLAVIPAEGRRIQDISAVIRGEFASMLQRIPGVASLRIVGLLEPEIKVDVDGDKLAAAGVALQQVARTVASSIYTAPVGSVVEERREYAVVATTGVDTVEEIRRIPVPTVVRGLVPLGEFARVYWDVKQPRSFFHHNGKQAVGIFIRSTPQSGSLNTARRVHGTLKQLRVVFREDLKVRVIEDPSRRIQSGIDNLLLAMLCGCLASLGVLLLIFRSVLVPIVVSLSVPASMMVVFVFMNLAGIDLNLVSLSGIAIGIGMIVDNSIVVADELLRNKAETPAAIASAAGSTGAALLGSTGTTLLVFLPVLFIPGVTGALFRDLALTIICLLIASLLCSLTLTPALYRLMIAGRAGFQDRLRNRGAVASFYKRILRRLFARPVFAVVIMASLVVAGALALRVLPRRILADVEVQALDLHVALPVNTPIRSSRTISQQIAWELESLEGVDSVFASAGCERDSTFTRDGQENDPRFVRFRIAMDSERSANPDTIRDEIERLLVDHAVSGYTLGRPPDSVRRLLGESDVVEFQMRGEHRNPLVDTARVINGELKKTRLIRSIESDTREMGLRLEMLMDPQKMASQRVEGAVVLLSLRTAVQGRVEAQLAVAGTRIDIRVRLDPKQISTDEQLAKVHVPADGQLVEAGILGSFEHARTYHRLARVDRSPAVTLVVHPYPGAYQRVIDLLSTTYRDRGEVLTVSALKRNQRDILIVFAFALMLMYLLVGAQFESLLLPLLLLLSLVPALSGSALALLLCGYSLNINSFLGMLILVGTAINICIILTAALRREGKISRERVVEICTVRLKPIAATVLSTLVAMIPIAVNSAGEAAMQSNTAVALLGGLFVAMISMLLAFPVLYTRFMSSRRS